MPENLTQKTAKNSIYSLLGNIIAKIGGLIFTIIAARLLLPELFGIYNLILSIALIAISFTDLGIGRTFVRYLSEELGRKNYEKARAYFWYLFKIRFTLVLVIIGIILIFGRFISENIFQKPVIYVPLLFSCFYIFTKSFQGLISSLFACFKDLKKDVYLQASLQFFRILLVISAIYFISKTFVISGIFIGLGFAVIFSSLIGFYLLKDKINLFGKKASKSEINKKRVLSYLGFATLVTISLKFFGSIDTLMLGRFVEAQYIGFYRASLSLITTLTGLVAFGSVLLPVFVQISGKKLERGFQQIVKYITILSIPMIFGLLILAKYFIITIYGVEYANTIIPFYAVLPLMFFYPLIALYSSLFSAKDKINHLAKFIFISLIIDIVLNYAFIKYFLNYSPLYVIASVGIATSISRGYYFIALYNKSKKDLNLKPKTSFIFKPLISALLMFGILFFINKYIDMNLLIGILEIIFGALIYFLILYLLNGFNKSDIELIKKVFSSKFQNNKNKV